MIKRSILFTVVALVLYALYIHNKAPQIAQHQWQANIIRTQNYIYTDSLLGDDMILGTSLTDKLAPRRLPDSLYMLTYPGLGVWDGFRVIKQSGGKPKFIFVEQNAILKPYSEQFNVYMFNPVNYHSKKELTVLRDAYQPIGQVAYFFTVHGKPFVKGFSRFILNPVLRAFQGDTPRTIDNSEYYAFMARMRNDVNYGHIDSTIRNLKAEVDYFQARGTKVYFYETPVAEVIIKNKQHAAVQAAFDKYLPPGKYHYIPHVPDVNAYGTIRDQVHLNDSSAVKFSHVFAKQIREARQNKL
ncbi:MAG: hypothetical protein EOP47_18990 [Sphingobacteriaceae bacterium]|nr:MAG: hypothetical protein EOP47_18990 [Sphingobacteriaceae bacterium]